MGAKGYDKLVEALDAICPGALEYIYCSQQR